MRFLDSLRNFVSGLGTAKDKTTHNAYAVRPLERWEIDALYLEDGFARKIIDIVPADEVREWRIWEAKQAEALYAAEKQLQIRAKVKQARTWARLYGGAAILIGDGSPDPSKPLDIATIGKGGIRYMHVLSRWELNPLEFDFDILSPNYGKAKLYSLGNIAANTAATIHHSRLVLFDGMDAPRLIREANLGWGLPMYQAIRTAIMNTASAIANTAALTEEAKLDIIKMPDLTNQLADPEGQRRLINRFTLASQAKSTINTLLIGADEEFERKQITFAGLPDLIRTHIEVVAGVADIPVTRLLGTAPKGMNATGEHDSRNYYDSVKARQETSLRDELEPLDEALIRHALGNRPRNITYEWKPLWQPSQAEKAAAAKTRADTTAVYASLGIFPKAGFAKSIREQLIENGDYPAFDANVTDADLTKLGNEPLQTTAKAGGDANNLEKSSPAALGNA